ncbi:tetratricopeptide repeat protein [Accumulibacter sp.]|uniref:tetratricopeptide repeat protein n=1 Tax=Accumulibacter sp. TaxID=2053492 RepID=UPI00260210EE|nr:tetratricopeptide repeat protein [Accumulibacter sp.]
MSRLASDPEPPKASGASRDGLSATGLDELLAQALGKAVACQQAGQLSEAGQLYRAILGAQPGHPQANHKLGLLAMQEQQPTEGLKYLNAALEARPEEAQYWLSYIDALLLTGQDDAACQLLALGQQHGLRGDAVDALLLRFADGRREATPVELTEGRQVSPVRPSGKEGEALVETGDEPGVQDEERLVTLFNAGRFGEGETIARALTGRFPEHGLGWKALGAMLQSQGRDGEALAAMRRAADLLPGDEQVHNNLGLVLANNGHLVESEWCHRQALKIHSDFAEAHYNLGNVLGAQGRHREAEASYRRAVALRPDFAAAHCNLANTLMDLGQLAEAETACRQALTLNPELAEAHNSLGKNLKAQGHLEQAESSYRQALRCKADYAEAYNNLGDTLRGLGRPEEAASALDSALRLRPDLAEAHYNLGNVCSDRGQVAEAEAAWRLALQHRPDFPEALVVLGVALREQGRLTEAEDSLRRALHNRPSFHEAHYNLGNILRDQERLSEAEDSYRRALEIKPDLANALLNLGVTLTELGRHRESEAACRQALAVNPDYPLAHSNLLFCLSHSEEIDAAALLAEHRRFGEQFEGPLRVHWPAHSNRKDPERCLQVGFVSGDLRNHAVANFIEPVLAQLAGERRLSLHAYAAQRIEDEVTQRLRQHLRRWHSVAGISDAALADRIRSDSIDVLIDLSGHTAHHRLLTFARKPAPLQVSWMGYPGTTGLQAMDYFLADPFYLPPGELDDQFVESIVRLPANAPFLPFAGAPPVSPLPALRQGHITFGSFNRPTKISPSVIALWSRLLTAVPNSRMLLGAMRPDRRVDQLLEDFARHGVERDRLSFHPRSDMPTYLSLHRQVDICLDTFPYTGGTTTLHALWMGVPTLTLAGHTAAGRPGASIMGHTGLDAFISHDAAGFVARGVACATDITALAALRAGLRERLLRSAIGQPALIAAGLERALRVMWKRWCDDLPPAAFEVRAQDLEIDHSIAGR